jgi:hypothetical protein
MKTAFELPDFCSQQPQKAHFLRREPAVVHMALQGRQHIARSSDWLQLRCV